VAEWLSIFDAATLHLQHFIDKVLTCTGQQDILGGVANRNLKPPSSYLQIYL
jgi:hypothetical protein